MDKNILIIDDDEEMCEELRDILSSEGYSVKCVHDGLSGKNLIVEDLYDVVLLDIKLPKLSGYEVLKFTKASPNKCKIFVMTGRPDIKYETGKVKDSALEDEERALKLSDGVISKPFEVQKILDTIKQALM